MELNIIDYVVSVLDSQNIKCTFLTPPYSNISEIDGGFQLKYTSHQEPYARIIHFIESKCEPHTLYMFRDNYMLSYVTFQDRKSRRVGKECTSWCCSRGEPEH